MRLKPAARRTYQLHRLSIHSTNVLLFIMQKYIPRIMAYLITPLIVLALVFTASKAKITIPANAIYGLLSGWGSILIVSLYMMNDKPIQITARKNFTSREKFWIRVLIVISLTGCVVSVTIDNLVTAYVCAGFIYACIEAFLFDHERNFKTR